MARGDSAPKSSSTTGATVDAAPPWVTGVVEALANAQKSFDPSNARAVVAVMDHYPTLLDAMAKFATNVGTRSVDAVDLPPQAQTMFRELGAMQAKAVGPVTTGLAAAKKLVADRIARYQAGRSQDAAWDVRANQQ